MGHIRRIEKQTENRFLNMYHLEFEDRAGNSRDYYFCTRNSDDRLKIRTHSLETEGICIYAVTREDPPRLVLVKEYRFPIDDEVYSLPAGLTDPRETPGEAAVREMKEETGFRFVEYRGGEAFYRRPFFLVPGFSDEPGSAVFGFAEDLSGIPENESSEWIRPILADKAEVRRILSEEKVSVRGAFLMFQFLQMDPGDPFAFLNGGK